jgi:hypothetical protein
VLGNLSNSGDACVRTLLFEGVSVYEYTGVCACACACMCVCECVCVRVCERECVCVLITYLGALVAE